MASCTGFFSPASWKDAQLHRYFRRFGLHSQNLQVQNDTLLQIWTPSQPSDKPPLLLIHGFGTNPVWQWHTQIQPLLKNFRLFLPSLIFFGQSTTSSPHRSEIFQAQIIDKAMQTLGIHRYSVVGTSYGGFVAFRLAHLFPQSVHHVVIANSGVSHTPRDTAGLLERANVDKDSDLLLPQSPEVLRTLMRLSFHKPPFLLPSFILSDAIDYFYIDNRAERVELLESLKLGKQDAEPLPTLSQKVLIIWGDHDGMFLPELAHHLKGHLGENAELVIVKDTAHCVQLENPREFTKLVEIFLLADD